MLNGTKQREDIAFSQFRGLFLLNDYLCVFVHNDVPVIKVVYVSVRASFPLFHLVQSNVPSVHIYYRVTFVLLPF